MPTVILARRGVGASAVVVTHEVDTRDDAMDPATTTTKIHRGPPRRMVTRRCIGVSGMVVVVVLLLFSLAYTTNNTVSSNHTHNNDNNRETTHNRWVTSNRVLQNCSLSYQPPPRREKEESQWRKPLWVPSYPASGSASPSRQGDVVKEVIDGTFQVCRDDGPYQFGFF